MRPANKSNAGRLCRPATGAATERLVATLRSCAQPPSMSRRSAETVARQEEEVALPAGAGEETSLSQGRYKMTGNVPGRNRQASPHCTAADCRLRGKGPTEG